jgi:uncharacterized OB-fold protein
MFGIERPLPNATEDTEAYWAACKAGKLVVSRCGGCGHRFLPPSSICPACLSADVSFQPVSGRGKIYSFIVVHRPLHPAFFEEAPYNVAIIQLEEGPRMHSRIIETPASELRVGLPVEVTFQKMDDEISLPMFRVVRGDHK